MEYKMFEFFNMFEDPRRGQGQRHKFHHVLTIVMMAILSGHKDYRGFSRFSESNEVELTKLLKLKHGAPRFNTIRDLIQSLGEDLLIENFAKWTKGYLPEMSDEYVALDGKAIKSTCVNGQSSLQNFIALVNAFGHESGTVYGATSYEKGKSGEEEALRNLILNLGMKDVVFTMDALHAKKNS